MTAIPLDPREYLKCEIFGAGRAWRTILQFLKGFNSSSMFQILLGITDNKPGKAEKAAEEARRHGILAAGREADIRTLSPDKVAPLIMMHVDDPDALGDAIARLTLSSIQAHLLARTDDDRLVGIHANIRRDDVETRDAASKLAKALAVNTTPSSSEDIFGTRGRAAHLAVEPNLRNDIGSDLVLNNEALFLNKPPVSPPLAISFNGQKPFPACVLDHRAGEFEDPALIAHTILDSPTTPIRTGNDIVVVEIGPNSEIRLHTVRRRRIDGRVAVNGVEVLDPRKVTPRNTDQWPAVVRQRDRLLAAAAASAITRKQPVMPTD